MIIITVQVDVPSGSEQAVKETLGMYMERFGDTRVIEIREDIPQQMTFGKLQNGSTAANCQKQRRNE